MPTRDIPVTSHGVDLAVRHRHASTDALTTARGRPCAVMAHGFGATQDSGLDAFARRLAEAGLDTLTFDYRGFGDSAGLPRQIADITGQLDDYRAVVAAARELPGVDPERIVLWGVSFAGGHVLRLAAEDHRVAATIALTAAADGLAAARAILRREGLRGALRSTRAALRDVAAARRGHPPVTVPLAGRPGTVAALTAPGAVEGYMQVAGPTWENAVAARAFLQLPRYRPGRRTPSVRCPLLVQIADLDQSAPAEATAAAAARASRAEVRRYPCDHFDVYPGQEWHEPVLEHQVAFLVRHLSPAGSPAAV